MVALDIAWLRIACFIAFFFVGLFLKRVLVVGALGSAIGVPAALVMILPDVAPLGPESLVEFVLWIWLCVTLGLTVNLGVQLLLAPGDPLTLLQRELDTRLRLVEDTVLGLGGLSDLTPSPPAMSLDSLATAGMSRPLALLKTASLTNARARQRHETLAAAITLVDRLLPDATTNPEYVRFAVKGALAALICYVLFIGFDYPGIYTSVITCFVVSLSTIGSSNQKGLLRFGGAAVGGVMGLVALVYVFPNVDGLGGFWLVFAAGTAVAAWINFGSPRISYGGYQTGLAFYKATLQTLGPAVSATVVRDRLIGVAFGLTVFGLVEHVLWPVRAADRMHARLADVFRSLAAFARVASQPPGDVDARRQLISQQVTDVQGFIESSKFEPGAGAADAEAVERLTADAQTVFLVLLAIAREAASAVRRPDAVRAAMIRVDEDVAAILE